MAQATGLSGNEIFCMAQKKYRAGELVVGNSVQSMGFLGAFAAGFKNMVGGEIPEVTAAIHEGRGAALRRMVEEANTHKADGITGVTGELRHMNGNTEFLFVGSCVHAEAADGSSFVSAGDAQELYCHMDAGYKPLQHVFGNIAYSTGIGGGLKGSLKSMARGEVKEFSDVFNNTRHLALQRVVAQAKANHANAVVGIRTTIHPWLGTFEMLMTGTACRNDALASTADFTPVTSDLTGEELWAMTSLGYAPVKLLMSTSIYSLGFGGGFMAAFKAFKRGEINELTTLVHEAREVAIGRLKAEADSLKAEEVIGIKTYIMEIGSGLIEFMAIGTAMTKLPGMAVATPFLPAQAIIRDKDTWIEHPPLFQLMREQG